jgi:hypothetical protein
MKARKTRSELDRQLEDVRRMLRDRHARVDPDDLFAGRVLARLPRDVSWSFDWAVRRVLPVSIALAMALVLAILATGRSTGNTSAPVSVSASSVSATNGNDPLEWLLEDRQELR